MTELDMLLQTTPETLPIALPPQAIRELQDEVMRLRRELEDCQEDLRDHKEERIRLRGGKEIKALTEEVERLKNELAMAVQVSGELCQKCGWAMKFPKEKCRCELLAEVERLTVGDEASTVLGANERFAPSEHALVYIEKWCDGSGPCAVELEPHGHWRLSRSVSLSSVRNAERDAAFKRGVKAMREAAVKECWNASDELADIPDMETEQGTLQNVAYRIRALPDPEDK